MQNRLKESQCIFMLEGVIVGILAGLAVSLFRFMVARAENIYDAVIISGNLIYMFMLWIASYAVVCLCLHLDINCSGSGIPRIKGELSGCVHTIWYKAFATMLFGSTCSIGAGMSMGQVGPSVQLGAMAAKGFSMFSDQLKKHTALLMSAGAGAGFAAILNAPLAGLAFSIEEINQKFSGKLLLASLTASVCADFVTSGLFGFTPLFAIALDRFLPAGSWYLLIIFGIIIGISGAIYNLSIKALQSGYRRMNKTWFQIMIPIACSAILALVYPHVLGGGNTLISDLMNTGWTIRALLILLIVKFIFTIICFSSGAPGGLVGPVLVIGAIIGALFAAFTGCSAYINHLMLLGMAGYFTASIRRPLTGILLAIEISGSLSCFPSVAVICLISHCTADLLKSQPIFEQLLENIRKKGAVEADENVVVK